MSLKIPDKYRPQVEHALAQMHEQNLFTPPGHQAMEPEGIDPGTWYGDLFRGIYDAPFPVGGKLGDWLPGVNAVEGFTKSGESLAQGDTGAGLMEGGFAMLDAIDPSPMAWGAAASGLGTMIGVGAKNFPHESLDIARDIEKAGGGRDEVFQQTGLWRGADDKWRSEISDSGLKMDAEGLSWGEAGDLNAGNSTVTSLQDVASHPEFDAAYPGVYGGRNDNGKRTTLGLNLERTGGDYSEGTDHIGLGISKGDLGGDLVFNPNERSVLGHETQHLVQGREGFARGGSPDKFANEARVAESQIRTLNDDMRRTIRSIDALDPKKDAEFITNLQKKYRRLMDERVDLVPIAQQDPYTQYRNLAGEVESRNVQKRLDYTPEQRRMIPPWMTEDVPMADQIVNFQGGGNAEQTAWHGSPHKWDNVDLGKIGTGEGAQAYGHGFYSAEDVGVGQQYKDNLASPTFLDDRGLSMSELGTAPPDRARAVVLSALENQKNVRGFKDYDIQDAMETAEGNIRLAIKVQENAGRPTDDFARRYYDSSLQEGKDRLDELGKLTPDNFTANDPGHLYELDINDDIIDKMLDWDAPLSEQSPHVLDALNTNIHESVTDFTKYRDSLAQKYGTRNFRSELEPAEIESMMSLRKRAEKHDFEKNISGQDLYAQLSVNKSEKGRGYSQKAASEHLNSLGIPGIKYWDGSSRAGGEGTRNFVNFNADDITAISRNGEPIHALENVEPILVGRNTDGSQYIADGNHRYWDAMDRGDSTIRGHYQPDENMTLKKAIEMMQGKSPIDFDLADLQPLIQRGLIK